jgi:cell division protein FtsB
MEITQVIEQLETEIKNLREENKKLKKKYYDVLDERNEFMYITEQLREEIKYKEE